MASTGRATKVAFRSLIDGVFGLLAAYFALRILAVYITGYGWDEMDWNADGTTSPPEILASGDIGRRPFSSGGITCTEYFPLKDGLPIKTVCTAN